MSTKNEKVNEILEGIDVLDAAERALLETGREAQAAGLSMKQLARERKDWRSYFFADAPIEVVGNDDVRLEKLRDQQKDEKAPDLNPMQVEELIWRQTMQKARKKAKRDKAKKKRQARRYNRPGR